MTTRLLPALFAASLALVAHADDDPRQYQHGASLVELPGRPAQLIWSSSGLPPKGAEPDGSWSHDVYVMPFDAPIVYGVPQGARVLIAKPEAQEPASSAVNSAGRLIVTMEDGWNARRTIAQRYGVYDATLKPVRGYPQMVEDGGHSGHVAAAGERFVVFYATDWVQGGGEFNRGTGLDVRVKVYDSDGRLRHSTPISVGQRDDWPVLASSPTRSLLVWQRFVPNAVHARLFAAVYDPQQGKLLGAPFELLHDVGYYRYQVAWLPAVERFVLAATRINGEGRAWLITADGRREVQLGCLPPPQREGSPVVDGSRLALPLGNGGALLLQVAPGSLTVAGRSPSRPLLSESGVVGRFTGTNELTLISLDRIGLTRHRLNFAEPEPVASCSLPPAAME
ncbi:hypothetical protein QU487_12995 [Crenobacter sp. SG2305]|uniref:hypothetical protein n=1 Tax=Crenobacter oryzisoli TaxID=3056844 RepID=UPI0025AA5B24|nr:hypothetical protein [Crenobacter sp. SG2305]MDN0083662.1 hypothetical protein [Crenobacter sp. SG2305]